MKHYERNYHVSCAECAVGMHSLITYFCGEVVARLRISLKQVGVAVRHIGDGGYANHIIRQVQLDLVVHSLSDRGQHQEALLDFLNIHSSRDIKNLIAIPKRTALTWEISQVTTIESFVAPSIEIPSFREKY